jgi:GTP-binding protein LepA
MDTKKIRNFVIIAHIDHGKSTLADRLLEATSTVSKRQLQPQYLDQLESERERGITIKMAPVRMTYKDHILNLIDTPGHSDFSYEVSRALAAVEGAILLVDAAQGIQAQTLANFEAAKKAGLKIIGAVTKVDLKPAHLEDTINTLAELLAVDSSDIIKVSGKTGEGVEDLLEHVIKDIPAPQAGDEKHQALIFDSYYDDHKGVIAFIRVFSGQFDPFKNIHFVATKSSSKIKELGYFQPKLTASEQLANGEIGYIATGIKDPNQIKIGDTITLKDTPSAALADYQEPQPVVFVSFYPQDNNDFDNLKQALAKLQLNDSSLVFEPDSSELLGRGFQSGFLGQLHFEIIAERLAKEFDLETVQSFPSVKYKVKTRSGMQDINSPKDFPDDYVEAQEPMVQLEIIAPAEYLGGVMSLTDVFRLSDFETENLGNRMLIKAKLPLADLISDFDDKLKSLSEGYASLNYELIGYQANELEKLEILVAGFVVPGLTRILPKDKVDREARASVEKLKELLPRQQFKQALQAKAHGQIIARETIPAFRKDVTGYLYGGDRTRKMKLWKKQQKGKARLQERADKTQVQIPASIFKELLKK